MAEELERNIVPSKLNAAISLLKHLEYFPKDYSLEGKNLEAETTRVEVGIFRAMKDEKITELEWVKHFYSDAEWKQLEQEVDEELELEQQKNELWQLTQRRGGSRIDCKNPFSGDHIMADTATKDPHIDVKKPSARFSTKRWEGKHAKTGQPVLCQGRAVENPSEQDMAFIGVFAKRAAQKSGLIPGGLNEFETQLFNELAEEHSWVEESGDQALEIKGPRVKALLDDGVSGGLEIAPIVFDEMLIRFPLLFAEVAPFVGQVVLPRGRRVEGASVGNPTVAWGTAEGTEIGLFNTADLVSALDTSIHPVSVAIEIGNDFLADSPANIGAILTQNIGQRFGEELDKVVAVGSGSDRPSGILQAAGVSVIASVNGTGGPAVVSDYEAMLFGVPKQYRQASSPSVRWLMSDTSYMRARGIAVGSGDQRRVFGMETNAHESYSLLGRPVSIQNSVPNSQIGFGDFRKYRLYRRSGTGVRFSSEGKELMRKNLTLMVARQRLGGRVMDANAFTKTTSAQA